MSNNKHLVERSSGNPIPRFKHSDLLPSVPEIFPHDTANETWSSSSDDIVLAFIRAERRDERSYKNQS
jgi:hypothetical protein